MNTKMIVRFLGNLCLVECAFFSPPLLLSLYDGDMVTAQAFFTSMCILLAASLLMRLCSKGGDNRFYAREGYFLVGSAWILMSLAGALPFFLSGEIPSFLNAFFETVSGFTTTGLTVLGDLSEVSRGLLLWRSLTNWLGGMGILVLLLAVAKERKGRGHTLHVLRAESPGPSVEKVVPRMHSHAQTLYAIYLGLSAVLLAILLLLRTPVFDAVNIMLSTAGTGGFGVRNSGMMDYGAAVQFVVMVFMILFGVNFNLHLLTFTGHWKTAIKDEELRVYLGMMLVSAAAIFFNVMHLFESFGQALLHSSFTVASIMSSTAFVTVDFNLWPSFSKMLLLLLMLVGASAGSTGGGMKVSRCLILVKDLRRSLQKLLRPRATKLVRLNGKPVDEAVVSGVYLYAVCHVMILLGAGLLVSLDNFSFESTFSAVISCTSNMGPALGETVGAGANYAAFSPLSKLVLSGCMLLGRLEIFPYLVFVNRRAWNRAR